MPARWIALIVTAAAIEAAAHAYGATVLVFGNFCALYVLLWIPLPLAVGALGFGLNRADLGLGEVRSQRGDGWRAAGILAAAALLVPLARLSQDTLAYYAPLADSAAPPLERILGFAAFSIPAILGWEVFHRGFLLFGLRRLGGDRWRAWALPIVAIFETLAHLGKPPIEIIAILGASPVLSAIALRTGSLWIPLGIHLFIEAAFAVAMAL